MRRNLELENWLIETTGEEMMANHLGPNWNRFNGDVGFYPNMSMTIADQVWQHQQSKVDELQKRVDELTVGCGLQRDHIKELETELKKAWTAVDQEAHKNHELVMLLKFIKEHFEMNDLDKVMPRVYEKLEQTLNGDKS
ncbi:hypothetical protein [Acinetobacter modestus]|uniref:hypothetical protein n=1 Tax=Acinetobacter modestus TaxID=1776740 RepID=UPI00301B3B89